MKNQLRYDRSTKAGRYDSSMRDIPWMFDSVPGWYFGDFAVGLTAIPHSSLMDEQYFSTHTIDPTILPD